MGIKHKCTMSAKSQRILKIQGCSVERRGGKEPLKEDGQVTTLACCYTAVVASRDGQINVALSKQTHGL